MKKPLICPNNEALALSPSKIYYLHYLRRIYKRPIIIFKSRSLIPFKEATIMVVGKKKKRNLTIIVRF